MRLFKCKHKWELTEKSNVLQFDELGYPLRLFIARCTKCGKSEQQWIDVAKSVSKELDTGESILLKWSKL